MLVWRAVYKDGKYLPQHNDDGSTNRYSDIDRYRLERFDLLNEDNKPVYSVYIREGQRLIFRKRHFIKVGSGEKSHVYLVGWQQTLYDSKGLLKNVTAINYVHEDGSIALDGHRDNLELYKEEL